MSALISYCIVCDCTLISGFDEGVCSEECALILSDFEMLDAELEPEVEPEPEPKTDASQEVKEIYFLHDAETETEKCCVQCDKKIEEKMEDKELVKSKLCSLKCKDAFANELAYERQQQYIEDMRQTHLEYDSSP